MPAFTLKKFGKTVAPRGANYDDFCTSLGLDEMEFRVYGLGISLISDVTMKVNTHEQVYTVVDRYLKD